MPCPLDEREELHLPEQIIDDTFLFAANFTSDVSNQEQQFQVYDIQPAQSASSCESSVVVENNQYKQNRHWKEKSRKIYDVNDKCYEIVLFGKYYLIDIFLIHLFLEYKNSRDLELTFQNYSSGL